MSEYTLVSSVVSQPKQGTYYAIRPSHYYVGFCGYLWQVIRAIYKYPEAKYNIYIGNPNGGPNVWEFYFQQPFSPSKDDSPIAEVGLLFDEDSEFVDVYPCMKSLSDSQKKARWDKFGNITARYFHLLPEVGGKVEAFRAAYFDKKKVFAFHCRGTDHPDRKDISESFPVIDATFENYDLMYASSDEKDIMVALKARYGNRMVAYDSTTRSDKCDFQMTRSEDTTPTHAFRYNAIINWSKENTGYQIGEDIIVETHLMSSADFLLCACNSNVNYFVRALNSNLPYKIIYTPEL